MYKSVYTIVNILQYNFENCPDKIALVEHEKEYSYAELYKMVHVLASYLKEVAKIKMNDRVCIYMQNQVEHVISIFAVASIGAIFVSVNKNLKGSQLKYVCDHCGVKKVIIVEKEIESDSLKEIDDDMILDFSRAVFYDKQTIVKLDQNIISTDIATIIYTSGSTGPPKGIIVSHQNLYLGAAIVSEYLKISNQERILGLLPLNFDYGLNQLFTAFYCQATICFHKGFMIHHIPQLLLQYKITGLAGVPPIWVQLMQLNNIHKNDYSCLRYITNSGGRIPQKCLEQLKSCFSHTDIYLMYGLTESFRSTYLEPDMIDKKHNSIGKPIPNTQVYILNEKNKECKPYEIGEIVSRGPLVTLGYWRDKKATEKAYKPNPMISSTVPYKDVVVYSGDKGYKDEEDYIYFVNRDNTIIKSKGYRTNPSQIEDAIYSLTEILECVVLGIEDEEAGDDSIVVFIRSNKSEKEYLTQLIMKTCHRILPHYMIPTHIIILEEFPRTSSGKNDLTRLKEHYINSHSKKTI